MKLFFHKPLVGIDKIVERITKLGIFTDACDLIYELRFYDIPVSKIDGQWTANPVELKKWVKAHDYLKKREKPEVEFRMKQSGRPARRKSSGLGSLFE
ncbi:MAG: hypothetical protein NT072_11990 [Deltaproteobacteria bacterium]|nr:hypothetical protein [Deltaproteobacteria bacterium]